MGEIIINEKPLNAAENKRLNVLESDIKKNFLGFVAVGNALAEIREKRLYRNEDNRTFDGYCRELWDMGRKQADKLAKAANVIENLTPIGVKFKDDPTFVMPINEAQARELSGLEAEEQQKIWLEILGRRTTQKNDEGELSKITAITVKKAVLEYRGKSLNAQINQTTKEARNNRKDFASDEFVEAYEVFMKQLQAEQSSGWRQTSRNRVFNDLSTLLDLVAQAGPKELKNRGCEMELSNREKLQEAGFSILRVRKDDLVTEEWDTGNDWMVAESYDTLNQLADGFKKLMEDPRNLRA